MTRLKQLHFFVITITLFIANQNLQGQARPQVAEEAIQGAPVEFINRTNRRASDFARNAEINTGSSLGEQILQNNQASTNQVQVIRIFDPDVEKYGADVMIILPAADYGHVRSIMRVVQGYLEKAFEYKPEQSRVLSELVVFYNASLRLKPELVQASYSVNVLNQLEQQKIGIDRSYRNWAGKTQLLIPLRKNVVRPDQSDLDREEIKIVIEQEKSIPQEKKEELRKIDEQRKQEDLQRIEQKEQELIKKEEQIQRQEQQIQQQQQNIQKQKEDTNRVLQELRKDPVKNEPQIKQEEQKLQQLEQQQQEIQKQQEQLQQQKEQIQQEKKELAEQKQELNQPQTTRKEEEQKENLQQAAKQETKPDEKLEALQKQVEELKKELQKEKELSDNVINEKIVFLKVIRYKDGHYNNELWMIDPNKDDALFRGPFTNICSREFLAVDKVGIFVVGYEEEIPDHSVHFLYLLDAETLKVKKKSKELVSFNTFMEVRDNFIYVIEEYQGKHYLARFDFELNHQGRSSAPIHPHSEVTFFRDKIYLTGSGNAPNIPIQVYNKNDLKLIKEINPKLITAR
ncbi:MAG: hypothetical protein NZ853_02465 [Leptospiraceae bacterium]|nr:hypothetical protein [Leptospiraceae bacterium]MDW7975043.1 P83/100 family protein [Leptospiraceae bacterium]